MLPKLFIMLVETTLHQTIPQFNFNYNKRFLQMMRYILIVDRLIFISIAAFDLIYVL